MADSVRYYTDEHVDNAVAEELRRLGLDAITTAEAGMLGRDDEEQLEFATQQGRVLFTKDIDFVTLAYTVHGHAGVVYGAGRSIGEIIAALVFIHSTLSADEMRGNLERI